MAYPVGPLSGTLSTRGGLSGKLSGRGALSGALSVAASVAQTYEGPYEVTPSFADQILSTKNYMMADNVTVNQITVTRTTNPYNGITVVIG